MVTGCREKKSAYHGLAKERVGCILVIGIQEREAAGKNNGKHRHNRYEGGNSCYTRQHAEDGVVPRNFKWESLDSRYELASHKARQ